MSNAQWRGVFFVTAIAACSGHPSVQHEEPSTLNMPAAEEGPPAGRRWRIRMPDTKRCKPSSSVTAYIQSGGGTIAIEYMINEIGPNVSIPALAGLFRYRTTLVRLVSFDGREIIIEPGIDQAAMRVAASNVLCVSAEPLQ